MSSHGAPCLQHRLAGAGEEERDEQVGVRLVGEQVGVVRRGTRPGGRTSAASTTRAGLRRRRGTPASRTLPVRASACAEPARQRAPRGRFAAREQERGRVGEPLLELRVRPAVGEVQVAEQLGRVGLAGQFVEDAVHPRAVPFAAGLHPTSSSGIPSSIKQPRAARKPHCHTHNLRARYRDGTMPTADSPRRSHFRRRNHAPESDRPHRGRHARRDDRRRGVEPGGRVRRRTGAKRAGIPVDVSSRARSPQFAEEVWSAVRAFAPDLVCFAGWLHLLPIPADFRHKVLNIHPALLPAFGGKGMYGHHVHEAVLAYGAKVSGCTVHFADDTYDTGPILVQKCVPVKERDDPDTLAARVFAAECEAYPEAIRLIASGRVTVEGRRVIVSG